MSAITNFYPALCRFIEIFSDELPIVDPTVKEDPKEKKAFQITQIALSNSPADLKKALLYGKEWLVQQATLKKVGKTSLSHSSLQYLRKQIHFITLAAQAQKQFYEKMGWNKVNEEIQQLQGKGVFTPRQKKLVLQVACTLKRVVSHYKRQGIFCETFRLFLKERVLPLEERIVRVEWRKKFRVVAQRAAKQASAWSLYQTHRDWVRQQTNKTSHKTIQNPGLGLFIKKISFNRLSEDELQASALVDFVSKQGMVPHFLAHTKTSTALVKPFIQNMQLFHPLLQERRIGTVLLHLSAESEFIANFSLFLQTQDLHALNVGFVPSLTQKKLWEVVLFDGGLCLGESSRIQVVQMDNKLQYIHPLRSCFLVDSPFSHRALRASTLDRILKIDTVTLAAWMDRSDAPIHAPFLQTKKQRLQKNLSSHLPDLSLSNLRWIKQYNHTMLTLSHVLDRQETARSHSEKNLLKQLLPRVSPLQKKSFLNRIDRARTYIQLWRTFSRFTQTASSDTHALLFYIRHPRLPFSTIQRCQLDHLVVHGQHKKSDEHLRSLLQQIRQAIEPTFFHLACVLYPDLADLSQLMIKVHKTTAAAMIRLGNCYRPLETDLRAVQDKFPKSEEAQVAAWIAYRLRRNPKKIFWAIWDE